MVGVNVVIDGGVGVCDGVVVGAVAGIFGCVFRLCVLVFWWCWCLVAANANG